VKERLHLKTYTTGETIYEEGERMDSLNVVLEGHAINYDASESDGEADSGVYVLRQNEILALEEIPDIRLSMHEDIVIKPIILHQKFTAAEMPVERTDIMSIYFDDLEAVYSRLREKENQRQLNTITKIKWFALLELHRAQSFKNQLTMQKVKKGQIVYDLGEPSKHFYLLQEGMIRIDAMFEIEQIRKYPKE